ncbi:MAG: hypothetical protein MJZ30_05830 [Paludibacteraceae bacterium]|nr:hypothetical protein [Paludibacteraceae bacterium]
MKRNMFSDFNEGQLNLVFTMLMAESEGTDPFTMEEELKNKGVIGKCSTL